MLGHIEVALHGQPHNGDVYELLYNMEYISVDGAGSTLPIDLHQINSIGQLADQLDFRLRGERLRGF